MATEIAAAPKMISPTQMAGAYGHQGYGPQALYSPADSTTATPANVSPTSPRSSHLTTSLHGGHPRQIRQPKVPMYIPAVLKPTEKPVKQQQITPPRSASNSFDSGKGVGSKIGHLHSGSFSSHMSRVITDEWNDEALGKVTGFPTKNHWKPDAQAPLCDAGTCERAFGIITRRHHCRRCGNIFCYQHITHTVPLDQNARFHPKGSPQRACDFCFDEYRHWEMLRTSRSNSESSESSQGPTATMNIRGRNADGSANPTVGSLKVGSVAGSVPRDWNWSTF